MRSKTVENLIHLLNNFTQLWLTLKHGYCFVIKKSYASYT